MKIQVQRGDTTVVLTPEQAARFKFQAGDQVMVTDAAGVRDVAVDGKQGLRVTFEDGRSLVLPAVEGFLRSESLGLTLGDQVVLFDGATGPPQTFEVVPTVDATSPTDDRPGGLRDEQVLPDVIDAAQADQGIVTPTIGASARLPGVARTVGFEPATHDAGEADDTLAEAVLGEGASPFARGVADDASQSDAEAADGREAGDGAPRAPAIHNTTPGQGASLASDGQGDGAPSPGAPATQGGLSFSIAPAVESSRAVPVTPANAGPATTPPAGDKAPAAPTGNGDTGGETPGGSTPATPAAPTAPAPVTGGSGGGGSGGGGSSPPAPVAPLEQIARYADSGANPAPTATTYTDAGVTGVTAGNAAAVNSAIDAATRVEADDVGEIQALVDVMLRVVDYATSGGTTPAPTKEDFAALHVAGVNDLNVLDLQTRVVAAGTAGTDTIAELRALVAPTVLDVATSTPAGTYGTDQVITILVTFDEPVVVDTTGGTPTLALETGAVDGQAVFAGGSGTDTLEFEYSVRAGDNHPDLDFASAAALALNGGAIRDADGNAAILTLPAPGAPGSLGANGAIALDAVFVPEPTITGLAAGSDTGSSATDGITTDTTPTILGTAAPGLTVLVRNGTAVLGTTTADLGGDWSFTPPAALGEGAYAFNARALDGVGNPSNPSAPLAVTIDLTPPGSPMVALEAASDTGASATDLITNDDTPTLTGTADPGATIAIFAGATSLGTTTADATGAWSFTPAAALGEGAQAITAQATDAAGNPGAPSSPLAVTIDTTPPPAAGAPVLAAASDTGTSNADALTNDATPTFTGTAVAGATVEIFDDATSLGTTTADGAGAWTFTPIAPLAEGARTITTRAVDVAGNLSVPSAALVVNLDLTGPGAVVTGIDAASDTGSSSTDAITRDNTPVIVGTSEPGARVQVFDSATLIGTVTADAAGNWTLGLGVPLAQGDRSITAQATDAAGNPGAPSAAKVVTVDLTPPPSPAVDGLAASADTGVSATDALTNQATPAIVGSADPGATVEIFDGATSLGTVTADAAGRWTFTPVVPFTEGTHAISAGVTDAAGNLGSASTARSVRVDLTAPAAPTLNSPAAGSDTGANAADGVTANGRPTFTGLGAPGAVIEVLDGAAVIGRTTVDAGGAWSFRPATDLPEGTRVITARTLDAAGNVSAATAPVTLGIDLTAPGTPVVTGLTAATDTGRSAIDGVTTQATPTIVGTAEAGLEVQVFDSSTLIGSVAADAAGNWSLPLGAPLAQGLHLISAMAVDAAGNIAAAGAARPIMIDGAAPGAPTITGLAAGSDTGANPLDGITGDATPTLVGTGEALATIEVFDGATSLGTTTADAAGRWTFTPAADLAAGSHGFTASATDAAGNPGGTSAAFSVDIDTGVPAAPAITGLAAGSDTGAADGVTFNRKPTLVGTAEPGVLVDLYDGALRIGTTRADAGGNWSFTPVDALSVGDRTFTARAVNALGNASPASGGLAVSIDAVPPGSPIVTGLTAGTDSGASLSDGITSVATPTIVGVAEANAAVEVYDGGISLGSVTADGLGNWSLALGAPLAAGTHAISVRAVDAAGNQAWSAAPTTIQLDQAAPDQAAIFGLAPADDTGASLSDGVTSQAAPELVGGAEPGATVELFDGATSLGTVVAGADGLWRFTPGAALADGPHSITAVARDAAGNAGPVSAPLALAIDTATPGTPAIAGLDATTDTGASATDGETRDVRPVVVGTADPGAMIEVYDGATLIGTTVADAGGDWRFTPASALAVGAHGLSARSRDAAGNASPATAALAVEVDLTPPGAPGAVALQAASDTGAAGDGVTANATPTLVGTGTPAATIEVFDDTVSLGTTTVAPDGTWAFTPAAPLATGLHSLTTIASDAAGNLSATAPAFAVSVDPTGPAAPVIAGLTPATDTGVSASDGITNVAAPVLRGTAEPGVTVRVLNGGTLVATTTADAAGTWSTPITLSAGPQSLVASAIDQAGNASGPSATTTLVLVTAPPGAPVISGLTPDSDSGASATDGVTRRVRPDIVGTAAPFATVTVSDGATALGSTAADANGDWTFTVPDALAAGAHALTAQATDPVGNLGAPSAPLNIFIDDAGPAAPVVAGLAATSDTGVSATDGLTSATTPEIRGTAEALAAVEVFDGATSLGTTTADAAGNWTFTPTAPLAAGSHGLTAIATDAAGNTSATAAPVTVGVDTVAPVAPAIAGLTPATDSGVNDADGVTGVPAPIIVGNAEPFATVRVLDGASVLGTVVADAAGSWSLPVPGATPLAEGAHNLTATATDPAGNVSAASAVRVVRIDSSISGAPTITGLTAGTDTGPSASDEQTSNARPTIVGTAEPDSAVRIFDGAALLGQTVADGDGNWAFTPAAALAAGPHVLTATYTDLVGNASPTSAAVTITIDATATATPGGVGLAAGSDTGASATDGVTSDPTPTLAGTAEAGATIEVWAGTTLLGTTAADALGNWSFTPAAALADGRYPLVVRAADLAGNPSAVTSSVVVQVDSVVPVAPVVIGLAPGDDTGADASDEATSLASPRIVGSAEPGTAVRVFDGATLLGTVTADAAGGWSLTPAAPLAAGAHVITAAAADLAGNPSASSAAVTVSIDSAAPGAPTITGLVAASDTGSSATDGITRVATPTVVGTAEAGTTVRVFDGATALGSAIADASGNWTFTPTTALSAAVHSITATATDVAGNPGVASAALAVTIDLTAPAAPVVSGLTAATDTGSSSADGRTTNTAPTLTGTAVVGSTIKIYDGDTLLGETVATVATWTFTPGTALAAGVHPITAVALDPAGNASAPSTVRNITIDPAAPGAPVIEGLTAATDTGGSDADRVTSTLRPTLTGTAEPGATLSIRDGGVAIGTATADTTGRWTFTPASDLTAGAHGVTAIATDATGSAGAESAGVTVSIDAGAPATPTIGGLTAATDTGTSSADGLTGQDTPTLTGTAEAGATVRVLESATLLGTATADAGGVWTLAVPLTAGPHTLTAQAVDVAGNASAVSAAATVTVDVTPPATPTVTGLAAANDSGTSNTDGITSALSPAINGTGEVGSVVTVFDNGTALGTATVGAGGTWTLTPASPLAAGSHSLTARAADAAGNLSATSVARAIAIDPTAPAAPVITGLGTADTGAHSDDGKTNTTTPTIVGTAEAGTTVQLFEGATLRGTATADASGVWSITPTAALTAGAHTFTAKATDAAGNLSAASAGKLFNVDAVRPGTPTLTGVIAASDSGSLATDGITRDATPTLAGTAENNALIEVYDGGVLIGTTAADGAGAWRYTSPTAWTDGDHVITVKAVDAAGNASLAASAAKTVKIDTGTPAVPVVSGLTTATDTGVVTNDGITSITMPAITGTGEAGTTVTVYDGANTLGSTTVAVGGAWTFTPTTALATGAHAITAAATDLAGNTSATSMAKVITIDPATPAVPVFTGLTAATDSGRSDTDLTTKNTNQTLVGTAEAGVKVQILDGGVQIAEVTADSAGAWTFAASLAAGTHPITARAVDTAGGTSAASAAKSVVVDVVAPAAAVVTGLTAATDTGTSTTDEITNDPTPSISGTAEANATVEVFDGTTSLGTTLASGTGAWTLVLSSALTAGTARSITAKATDAAGNLGTASVALPVTIDVTAPGAPTITGLTAATDTGASSTDGITSDVTPDIMGTAEKGATVQVYDGATLKGTTTADATTGAWTYTSPTLTAGSHTITAKAIDVAGNASVASPPDTVVIDTTQTTPVITGLTSVSDTGKSSTDLTTTDTRPVLVGTAEANSTVTVRDAVTAIGTTTADATGAWSFRPTTALTATSHVFTAVFTDGAGNTSAASLSKTVVIDTTAPTAPVITGIIATSDTGTSTSDGLTTDTTPTIAGTSEANATVQIYQSGNLLGSVTASAAGAWTFTPTAALPDGTHSITAKAVDTAGNTSAASTAYGFTIGKVPSTPVLDGLTPATDTGFSRTDGITTDVTPTLAGTGQAGSVLEIIQGASTVLGTATVNSTGNWTFTTAALAAGTYTFKARDTDVGGGTVNSATKTITIDNTAATVTVVKGTPNTTVNPGTAINVTVTFSEAVYVDTTNGVPTIQLETGTTDRKASYVSGSGTTILTFAYDVNGGDTSASLDYVATTSLALNSGTITNAAGTAATLTLPAVGSASSLAGQTNIVLGGTIPAVPVVMGVQGSGGTIDPDDATNDPTPIIQGVATANATVTVLVAGVSQGTAVASASGNWTFTFATSLTDGIKSITAKIGAGTASAAKSITIDTQISAPTVTGLVSTSNTGSTADQITADQSPEISGTLPANASSGVVTVKDGATTLGTVKATGTTWKFTPSTSLAAGDHTITATVEDAAGNVSVASAGKVINIDAVAPATPTLTGITAATDLGTSTTDRITSDPTPTFTGTAAASTKVEVYAGITLLGSTTSAADGSWTYTPTAALANGVHTITARAVDTADNTSAASTSKTITINDLTLVASVLGLTGATDTGNSSTDGTTSNTKPTIVGTASAGATIQVKDGATVLGTATANGAGDWSYTPTAVLAAGSHSITAVASDLAGNTVTSAAKAIKIESTAPTVTGVNSTASGVQTVGDTVTISVVFSEKVNVDVATGVPTLTLETGATDRKAIYTGGTGTTTLTFSYAVQTGDTSTDLNYVATSSLALNGATIESVSGVNAVLTLPALAAATSLAGSEAIVIDTAAPAVPVITGLVATSDSGSSSTDRVTSDTTPAITGTADPGVIVEVYDSATKLGQVTANATTGAWTYTPVAALTATVHTITAKAVDTAGNSSAPSSPKIVTIDATAPAKPVVTGLTAATDTGTSTTDAITKNTKPTIVGTAEAGAAIKILDGATQIGTATADSSGDWSFTPTTALTAAAHTITATATDLAGSTSLASTAKTVTVDTSTPASPTVTGLTAATDTGTSTTDGLTRNATPTIAGTLTAAAAGTKVEIYDGGVLIGTTTTSTTAWSFTPATALATGAHTITAKAGDTAGNTSLASASKTITIDAALASPVITGITAATDTGASTSDGITKTLRPVITGTAEASATVTVYDSSPPTPTVLGTVAASAAGAWTFTPTADLAQGSHDITATAADAAGNTSVASVIKTLVVDTGLPAAPVITGLTATSDLGASSIDGITSDATPTVIGTAEAGATVRVLAGGTLLGTTTADPTGVWTYTPTTALTTGTKSITAEAVDLAGNTGPASAAFTAQIDTSAPATPAAPALAAASDTGTSATDGVTSDATPTLTGTTEAGATVRVFDGGVQIGSAIADPTGAWSFTPAADLTLGAHPLTVTAMDVAGNTTVASAAKTVTIDTGAPSAPVISGLTAATDTGESATDEVTKTLKPAITGTADAGTTIQVFDGAVSLGTTTTGAGGTWTFTPAANLAAGSHAISAVALDGAGNASPGSPVTTLVVDATAPATPTFAGLTSASDTGADPTDGKTTAATPTFVGTAATGDIVQVFDSATLIGQATTAADGFWRVTPAAALSEGAHTITAKATDLAGNLSTASGARTITVDTIAPATPTITGLAAGSDAGASASDGITRMSTPTLAGTAEAGATVQILDGATVLGQTTASGAGAWTFTPTTALATGPHTFTARTVDAAGNTSPASGALAVSLDFVAPAAPVFNGITAAGDSGASSTDGITNVATPTFSGTAEVGATVRVIDGGVLLGTAIAGVGGAWTFTPGTALAEGSHAIATQAVDAAGNFGPLSATRTIVVDGGAPSAPRIAGLAVGSDTGAAATDGITSDAIPTLVGAAEPGATLTILDGAATLGTATADATGAWAFTPGSALATGAHAITAIATDRAGNVSGASTAFALEIDGAAAAVPTVTGIVATSDTGASSADGVTRVTTPTLTGTAEPGTIVTVFDSATAIGEAAVDAGGNWTLVPASPLAAGPHTITATATDRAGQASAASAPTTIEIDTATPATPTLAGLTTASDTGASNADGLTSQGMPTLTGTAGAGDVVAVYDGTTRLGTATADGAGDWSFTPAAPLTADAHTITAAAEDLAGNMSAGSLARAVTVDATAPATPTVSGLTASTDSGVSNVDGVTGVTTPRIVGTAEPGASVAVFDGAALIGTVTADGAGTWALDIGLAEGAHPISVVATDAAGNASGASAARTITIDTTTGPAPAVAGLEASTDTGTSAIDNLTANARPTLVGSADPLATVQVFDGPTLLGSTTADAGGAWRFTPPTPLSVGAHPITATYTDLVGNVSAASPAVVVTIDPAAPATPVITGLAAGHDTGPSGTDGVTSIATPTITGTADAFMTVRVLDGTTSLGTTVADGTGAWTFTPAAPLTAGVHALTAIALDDAGNVGASAGTFSLVVDATAPATPVVSGLAPASDTGLSPVDGVTSQARPAIVGSAEPGAAVEVFDGVTSLGTVTADALGKWSFTPASDLTAGGHALTARATDTAGNLSATSLAASISVDATPPATPAIAGLTAASDTGVSAVDGLTRLTRPTLAGTAEPGAIVEIFEGATLVDSTTADAGGAWALALNLTPGAHGLTARATDAAGQASPNSAAFTATVDVLAPATATIAGLAADTGASAVDGITADAMPTFTGVADADARIILMAGGAVIGTTTADAGGAWSVTPVAALAEGAHAVFAQALDAAGNAGDSTAGLAIVVDTIAPDAPVVSGLAAASDSGPDPADGITSVLRPTIRGTAEPGAVVEVFDGVASLGAVTADAQGVWSLVPSSDLATGAHALTAIATDLAGGVSPVSAVAGIAIAGALAAAPVVTGLAAASDTGVSAADGLTALARPAITGTATPNAAVRVFVDGTLAGTVAADGAGAWTFTPPADLTEGARVVTARVADAAGELGPLSTAFAFTVDRTAPTAPAIDTVQDDTGPDAGDGITADATPEVGGTGENGSLVELFDGATSLGTTTVAGGRWAITPPALADGSHALTVVATDQAGNTRLGDAPWQLVVDGASPETPVVIGLTPATDTGASDVDGITANATPTIRGVAMPGSRVEIFDNSPPTPTALGTATADGTGAWTLTPGTALAAGPHDLTAVATSAAGAVSAASAIRTITIAAGTPAAPVIAGLAAETDSGGLDDDGVTALGLPTIVGTAAANARVEIREGAALIGTATADASGDWRFAPASALAEGPHTLTAVAFDDVGAASGTSAPITITIDGTAPLAPTLVGLSPATDTGAIDDDGVTRLARPTLVGTAEPGAVVEIRQGAALLGETTADASGDWQFAVPADLAEGAHSFTARQTDLAGNAGPAAPFQPITVDLTAPDAATVTGITPATDDGTSDGDGATSVARPTIVGTAEAGATVEVFDGATSLGTATADNAGQWELDVSSDLAVGTHGITVAATDLAGNAGGASSSFALVIDPAAPAPYRLAVEPDGAGLWFGDFAEMVVPAAAGPLGAEPLFVQDLLMMQADAGAVVWSADASTQAMAWVADANTPLVLPPAVAPMLSPELYREMV